MNETLRQTEECRVHCEVASQRLPEDRGVDGVSGVFEKAAGKRNQPPAMGFSLPLKAEQRAKRPPLLLCPPQLCLSPCSRVGSTV